MSGFRMIALLVFGYLVFVLVFPRFEGDILNRMAQTEVIQESQTFAAWIDGMTTCECAQGRTPCTPYCTHDRKLDGSSPQTVATGFFASTFVLTPFVSRHLVFIRTYREHRTEAWGFAAIAAMAMFIACVINFLLGACLGLMTGSSKLGKRWTGWLDRWGPGVFVLGCFAPLGFPIGLASFYLGMRLTRLDHFLSVAALGCVCHIFMLITVSDSLHRWWGS